MQLNILKLVLCLVILFWLTESISSNQSLPVLADVIGLSAAELKIKFPEVTEPSHSFMLLVSKNLHPYKPPDCNQFLRLGDRYLVFELHENEVIAIHKVGG